jgi:hypothetical protein
VDAQHQAAERPPSGRQRLADVGQQIELAEIALRSAQAERQRLESRWRADKFELARARADEARAIEWLRHLQQAGRDHLLGALWDTLANLHGPGLALGIRGEFELQESSSSVPGPSSRAARSPGRSPLPVRPGATIAEGSIMRSRVSPPFGGQITSLRSAESTLTSIRTPGFSRFHRSQPLSVGAVSACPIGDAQGTAGAAPRRSMRFRASQGAAPGAPPGAQAARRAL